MLCVEKLQERPVSEFKDAVADFVENPGAPCEVFNQRGGSLGWPPSL